MVIATIASSETPYRRSWAAAGTASRSKIVLSWSRDSRPATTWNSDSVVSSMVAADDRAALVVPDLVGHQRPNGHHRALDAQPDPVGA